jgi:NAD-dependent SIR2 family protein deacetylase
VFQLSFFRDNPKPCQCVGLDAGHVGLMTSRSVYTFAKDFDPTKFRPTVAHSFLTLLHKKGLLRTCFTQNIDGLGRSLGSINVRHSAVLMPRTRAACASSGGRARRGTWDNRGPALRRVWSGSGCGQDVGEHPRGQGLLLRRVQDASG